MGKDDHRIILTTRLNCMLQNRARNLTHSTCDFRIRNTLKSEEVSPVSVAHELSCEIAAAILARKEETHKLEELKELVLRIHFLLQKLTIQSREHEGTRALAKRSGG